MGVVNMDVTGHLKRFIYFYILLAVIIIFNIPIFVDLVRDWIDDSNYSHGFLVIPLSIFLIYRRRHELHFHASPYKIGILVMLAGCAGLIFGFAAGEYFTTRVSLLLIITGLSLYFMGLENFRKIWFAFLFLIFMIPIPAVIYHTATLPMQLFATKVTHALLSLIGMPSLRQGNILYLPNYTLEVAEACSGLRSLETLMALGGLYGYLTLPGRILPVTLFLSAIPIAVVTNIVRLLFTAIGAYVISPKVAEDFLHELSGLVVFACALILMFIVGALLKWLRKRLS